MAGKLGVCRSGLYERSGCIPVTEIEGDRGHHGVSCTGKYVQVSEFVRASRSFREFVGDIPDLPCVSEDADRAAIGVTSYGCDQLVPYRVDGVRDSAGAQCGVVR